jgi:hypothetical protein
MSVDNNFSLVYCNGDSYSDHHFHPTLLNNTYVNVVANYCQGFAINSAISGSCNRRIIRTTLHDMILQRKLNPTQQIIALIGLSFEIRSEIWIDSETSHKPEESNFKTHAFTHQVDWRDRLLAGNSIDTPPLKQKVEPKFYNEFSRGRAYFYSPYAERINLLADLIMLTSVLNSLDVKFLIFQSPLPQKLESDYLLDFFKAQLSDNPNIFDLETFAFCNWCLSKNFVPLDFLDRPEIGHHGPSAHRAFAEQILIPKLKELSIL